jgi:dihydrofolate synthase/folylpolyglutamate synthase
VTAAVYIIMVDDILELYKGLERDLGALIGPVPFSSDINLRLERIRHLLTLLGDPHLTFPSIHVGGTSGKGSTATIIATILKEAGYKTGLHTSPHLQILNERHQINGQIVSTSRLGELFSEMKPAIAKVAAENPFGSPSYFEAQVALAFYLFQQAQVDVTVIEVGLGGTLDATNVLNSDVVVLTNVGLDHTAVLGENIEAIIRDKAGIIKSGQVVISGVRQQTARDIVAQRCQTEKAELWQIGRDFHYEVQNDRSFSISTPLQTYTNLKLSMKGDFQFENAACAVAAVQALPGFDVTEEAIRTGVLQAQIPGRMEIIQTAPTVILDGAHNPEKMKASNQAIDDYFGNKCRLVVLSLKSDKAASDVLPYIVNGADLLILTKFHLAGLWEPMNPETLAQLSTRVVPDLDIRIEPDPILAFEQALLEAKPDDIIWVTGSLYLVGNIREYWYPSTDLIAQAENGLAGSLTF